MKYFFAILLVAIGTGFFAQELQAQGKTDSNILAADYVLPPGDVLLSYEFTAPEGDLTPEEDPLQLGPETLSGQEVEVMLTLQLYSTKDLAKIHVKIGHQAGSADFMDYTFQSTGVKEKGSPYRLQRKGNKIVLTCGKMTGISKLFAEVILEDYSGNKSAPKYHYPE